jgi:ADP-ribosylglycohydrolase
LRKLSGGIFGLIVGDALGVPVEFLPIKASQEFIMVLKHSQKIA